MGKVTDYNLDDLIYGLKGYKANGVVDPWLLSDGTIIEPLDVLIELRELRKKLATHPKREVPKYMGKV